MSSISVTSYRRKGARYYSMSLPPVEYSSLYTKINAIVYNLDPESLENLLVGIDSMAY